MRFYTRWTNSLIRRWIHHSTRSIPHADTHRVLYWINRTVWIWGRRTNFMERVIHHLAKIDPTYRWAMFLLDHGRCQVPDAALRILIEVSYTPVPRLTTTLYRAECIRRLIRRIKYQSPAEHRDTLTFNDLYPVFQRVVHLMSADTGLLDDIDAILVGRLLLDERPICRSGDSLLLQLPLCMAQLEMNYDIVGVDDVDSDA